MDKAVCPIDDGPEDLRLDAGRAALLLVDFQERLAAAMPAVERAACERNVLILIETAQQLRLPVVSSEQYPKGLGPTVASVTQALKRPGLDVHRFEKMAFGCTDEGAFADIYRRLARSQWIVSGMETHVCVYQTARGLRGWGAAVHVPADAVLSRTAENRRVGQELIERAGGVITSTEAVVFDVLKHAGTDEFKALSRLLK